ncbi:MAG: bacterial regulatory s, gntR family protein [Acidimicrobiaceae bacterium]|nr:bacterial regulatory s, gntR family protein [Acidimicrobiaceae bacterium]
MSESTKVVPVRAQELADLIVTRFAGGGAAGVQFPTERRLAQELQVTRTAIRRALQTLEDEGRISREVGRGTFLLAGPASQSAGTPLPDSSALNPDDFGPADVMAARRLIEPRLVPLVVSWATERDFQEMERCLLGGEAAESVEEFETWDLALHRSIVLASHNPLIVRMYGPVESARQGRVWGNLKRRSDAPGRRQERRREHRELVSALRAREVGAAVRATEVHLERVESTLLGHAETNDGAANA